MDMFGIREPVMGADFYRDERLPVDASGGHRPTIKPNA
jgi:hypothetical protein